jgi:transposase-like protein
MSMPESERLLDYDCPYCLLQREIIAVKFSLLKPCAPLFVCPSCGSTFTDVNGPSNKRGRSWHLKAYLHLRRKRARTVSLT